MQVTRVVLEYSDGSKRYLDAEDCQKWLVYNQQVATCAMIHGMCPPFEQLDWKEGKHIEHEQKDKKEDESENPVKEN